MAKKKAPKAKAYRTIATLTITGFDLLADSARAELQDWLRRRISEIQGQAINGKRYTAHYKLPIEPKS